MRSEDDNRLSEERLLSDHDADLFKPHISRHTWRDSTKFWTIQVICFTISFSLFLGAVYYHRSSQPCNCTDYMPMYSPALEALEGTNHLQRFDGSFAKGNAFKGTPNPDIDAAWESITYQNGKHYRSIKIFFFSFLKEKEKKNEVVWTNALRRRHKHL